MLNEGAKSIRSFLTLTSYFGQLEALLCVIYGRRETRTLTISRHILSVVRLPIPPLARDLTFTTISIVYLRQLIQGIVSKLFSWTANV